MDNIEKYLKENKSEFPKEILINELKKSGYKDEDIEKGIQKVFGPNKTEHQINQPDRVDSFWNFSNRKSYQTGSEKFLDFLFGLFAPWILGVLNLISPLFGIILFVGYIFALIYLFNRRRYVFYGLIANMVLPLLAALVFITVLLPRIRM